MPARAVRASLVACLLAALAGACRAPEDARDEARAGRDAFEAELDAAPAED